MEGSKLLVLRTRRRNIKFATTLQLRISPPKMTIFETDSPILALFIQISSFLVKCFASTVTNNHSSANNATSRNNVGFPTEYTYYLV